MTDKLRLGGMALGNGLLVHGPTRWAAAVRREDGSVAVASGPKPRLGGRAERVAGLRGVLRIAEAMAVIPLVKRALPEARLPFEDGRVAVTAVGVSLVASVLRKRAAGALPGELAVAALSLVPSLVALRGGDLATWHGVEHKAIGGYEADGDASEATKEHDRCGSHLMAPMLAANVAGTALLRRAVGRTTPAAQGAVALASIGVAVEVFAWTEQHAETAAARALRRPGHELQRLLGTREPDAEQLGVGQAALDEILRVEAP
ncbi:MAG: DUF1385 domain-containing protein [Actinomycetota bacterium]|nr:DUF1385 domain-containing protein [Actinomycetota bacterium]